MGHHTQYQGAGVLSKSPGDSTVKGRRSCGRLGAGLRECRRVRIEACRSGNALEVSDSTEMLSGN